MPKEVVHGESFHSEDKPEDEWEHPVAVVTWSRESGDVQLVTRLHGAEVPSIEEHEKGIPVQYGYYVSLDRAGLNKLIRNLRRARDQAFGRDE